MVTDFQIYTKKSTEPGRLGITGESVMNLWKNIWKISTLDNYYTSLSLLKKLMTKGILSVGTIRKNRLLRSQNNLKDEKKTKI